MVNITGICTQTNENVYYKTKDVLLNNIQAMDTIERYLMEHCQNTDQVKFLLYKPKEYYTEAENIFMMIDKDKDETDKYYKIMDLLRQAKNEIDYSSNYGEMKDFAIKNCNSKN